MTMWRGMRMAGFALFLMASGGQAQIIGPAEGPIILTVTGLDKAIFPSGTLALDLAMLQTLDRVEITTSSIWTEGRRTYTGVLLKHLTDTLAIKGGQLRLHALNDYQVDFPLDEATGEAPVLAYWMDGASISVRDKGPLWLIYPYDAAAKYRTDTVFARSIWQLDRIDVLR